MFTTRGVGLVTVSQKGHDVPRNREFGARGARNRASCRRSSLTARFRAKIVSQRVKASHGRTHASLGRLSEDFVFREKQPRHTVHSVELCPSRGGSITEVTRRADRGRDLLTPAATSRTSRNHPSIASLIRDLEDLGNYYPPLSPVCENTAP